MFLTAVINISFANFDASSAAEFNDSSNCLTCNFNPAFIKVDFISSASAGNGILIKLLLLNPPFSDANSEELDAPTSNASFSPLAISDLLNSFVVITSFAFVAAIFNSFQLCAYALLTKTDKTTLNRIFIINYFFAKIRINTKINAQKTFFIYIC